MQLSLSPRDHSLPSAAKAFLAAISVAFGFLLIASNVGGQTGGDDHGNSFDTATLVELGTSVEARIDPGDDRDVFKFDLSDASGTTDLWVYTRGDFDTFGGLYDSTGTLIALNDDGFFDDQLRAFSIRSVVEPGVYYVIVVSYLGEPGDYTLHARAVTDPGSSIKTAKPLVLGSHNGGTVDTGDDVDYFRLDFTEKKHVIIDARSSNLLALDAALLDADGKEITANIAPIRLRGFGALFPIGIEIAEDFEPGTYYLKVTSPGAPSLFGPPPDEAPGKPVPYAIFFEEDVDYAELLAGCAADTVALNDPAIGDPLYSCQWHLNSPQWHNINVQSVWEEGIKGEGIGVAVVDDGIYHAHEDLKDNIAADLNFDYGVGGTDIYGPLDHHGTHVAGMIAARDNEIGVRGVAPRATVYGYNLLSGRNTTGLNVVDAMTRNMGVTAVSNNSWGPSDGPGPSPGFAIMRQAINAGITEGYDGKGTLYVFAAGNGHLLGDDANLDGFANNHAVTAVCSVHSEGRRAGYSEMGANLWVCAPSNDRPESLGGARGILTTENSDRYYSDFGGTSAAAPLVSGVSALTRDANSDLTWRDVKLILAASASKNDPASAGWEYGASKHPVSTASKYHFNHEYGFGVVDAQGAVDLAKRWTNLPEMQQVTVETFEEEDAGDEGDAGEEGDAGDEGDEGDAGEEGDAGDEGDAGEEEGAGEAEEVDENYVEIPDAASYGSATTTTQTLTVETGIGFTEFVEVTIAFEHDSFRDLEILLESPSGAVSKLAVPFDTYDGLNNFFGEGFIPVYGPYQFGSAKHLGEDPNGEWKLHITDRIPGAGGGITGFAITVYGHERAPGVATLDSVDVHVGGERLDLAWTAPGEPGDSAITGYDVRYIPTEADETDLSGWTVLEGVWTAAAGGELEYSVTGLTDGTQYDVQVRAVNSSGGGLWSESGTGTPMSSQCVTGGAVTDRSNGGVIHDCEALLEARDTLAGIESTRTLNWTTVTPIDDWYGVVLTGTPERVVHLRLDGRNADEDTGVAEEKLNGTVPAALGRLSELTVLYLHRNNLTGTIPSELGGLTSLNRLYLHENELSGSIPSELGGLTGLTHLLLQGNDLDGPIPAELGDISSLVWLSLYQNVLTGPIPSKLGGLTNLQQLLLHQNRLSGNIPSELGNLESLERWRLRGNRLTGCVPAELAAVTDNDQVGLGLPTCTDS